MLCNKITLYSYILSLYIMQQDNFYEIKKKKKDNNLKQFQIIQKLINLKQRYKKNNKKIHQKMKKKNFERERNNLVCGKTMYRMKLRIVNLQ